MKKSAIIFMGIIFLGFVLISGCTLPLLYDVSPQGRLSANPSLVAACQFEIWENTSHQVQISTGSEIKTVNKSETNHVCYFRDNHTTIQRIGEFEDVLSAFSYIWVNYDHSAWIVKK